MIRPSHAESLRSHANAEMRTPRPTLSRLRDAPKSFKLADDKIGDDGLNFEGFCAMVKSMEGEQPIKELRARFDKLDSDGDGIIDKSQFFAGAILEALVGADIPKLFAAMDTDGNHSVSRQEFATAIRKLSNFDVPRATSDSVFSIFDDDNSGEVDYREVAAKVNKGAVPGLLKRIKGGRLQKALGSQARLTVNSDETVQAQLIRLLDSNMSRVIDLFRDCVCPGLDPSTLDRITPCCPRPTL